MKWRFIDLGEIDPFLGPATFEAVMDAVEKKESEATVLFWRPKSQAVYIGFHQLAHQDIDIPACRDAGIPVIRRTLGGGTGYCDRNQVIYNIIFREDGSFVGRGPEAVYIHVLRGLIEALDILGISRCSIDKERFGVHASSRKISGSGQLTDKGVVNSSGSFLVDFDFQMMKRCLRDPVKNLKKGIKEPEEGMTCIRKELGRDVSMDEASLALRAGFERILGKTTDGRLSGYEKSLSKELRHRYTTEEWTFRADHRKMRRQ